MTVWCSPVQLWDVGNLLSAGLNVYNWLGSKLKGTCSYDFFQEPPPPRSTSTCQQGHLVLTHFRRRAGNECVRCLHIQVVAEEAWSQRVNTFWCTMLHCLVCFRKAGAPFPFLQTKCNTIEQSHMNLLCLIGLLAGL